MFVLLIIKETFFYKIILPQIAIF